MRNWALGLGVFVLTAGAAVAMPPPKIALSGGRIIPIAGDEIASGTVVIENGLITAVGKDVEIPYDAIEIDVSGKVVMPGFVDAHSYRGLDISNENLPVTPYLDVYDAIDPSRLYFEDALRDGITSVHTIVANDCVIGGVSRVLHPIGMTPDEMTQKASVALKMSFAPKRGTDRMAQMVALREVFLDLDQYLEELAEKKYEESLEEKDEKIDVGPEEARKRGRELIKPEDYDDKHRNLIRLTEGELGAYIWCGRATDVGKAVKLASDRGFLDRSVLVLGAECYKAVEEVKASGRPVVLDDQLIHREQDPITGEIKETFVPKAYADAEIPFSLLPSPDSSLAERYLTYQAARCVRNGIDRKTALKAITLNPAEASGVGDLVGSLEKGKKGNVVVLSGDPLAFTSWVDQVYINGIKAYDREDDVRLKRLFETEEEVADEKAPSESEPSDEDPQNEAPEETKKG